MTNGRALAIVALWFLVALGVGAAGLPAKLQPPIPQVLIGVLAVGVIAAVMFVPALRSWIETVDERLLVGLHLSRFVGIWFLVLHSQGRLPWDFAVPGGIGDIFVAVLALMLIATMRADNDTGRGAYLVWNVIGLGDILFVVVTAARLAVTEPGSMDEILRLPLCLLPTWLVPLIIATHVLLFYRLARGRSK